MKKLLVLILVTIPFVNGCYYDNFEEIHPVLNETCDTTGTITYTNTVAAILTSKCGSGDISCHKAGNTADIVLDSYVELNNYVLDGSFIGSILHQTGFKPMPKGGGTLDNCNIQKIQAWLNRGNPQ
jgi:hypothetical protein